MTDQFLPTEAEVVDKVMETPDVATLSLRLTNPDVREKYTFHCGQFNMLYLYGIGEVPISIMDAQEDRLLHTIRGIGKVTNKLIKLAPGAKLGLRGPFGNSWPLESAKGRDVVFITAGLGCAPVIAAILQVIGNRHNYRRLVIMQGVKQRSDLLWEATYDSWRQLPDCQVLLAASEERRVPPRWSLGMVTVLLEKAKFDPADCVVMMCGPEPMLRAALVSLEKMGVPAEQCYASLERNMQCGMGLCGHCQLGPHLVCHHGPIFTVSRINDWLQLRGF